MSDSPDSEAALRELKFKMATELAHELRTPVGGIVGINELMLMSELTAEQQQFAETIQDSAKAMLQLLTDLVELARLDAEKVTPTAAPFDLKTTLDECKYMLKKHLKPRKIELQIEQNEVPALLNGDSLLIQQFICGVTLAASKYVESGTILLEVTKLADPAVLTKIQFKFTLPPNTVNRSKQPLFTQLANENDPITRFDSTWLRLSIAQKLLKLLKATPRVDGNQLTVDIDFAE